LPNNIRIWIDALRSGDYTQGHKRLTTIEPDGKTKHCCLGVACQEAIKHGVELNVVHDVLPDYEDAEYIRYNGEDAILPKAVEDWLGIDEANPVLVDNLTAAELNDSEGYTYAQIADEIERTYFGEKS
jgi:hypothetical protein